MTVNAIGYQQPVQPPPPPPPPKQHEVVRGETIDSIAKANGTTPQALIGANPQLANPDHLYPGDLLNLPAAAAEDGSGGGSVKATGDDTARTGTDANGTSSKSEASVGVSDDGVTVGGKQTDKTTTTDANGSKTTSGTTTGASVGVDPDKGTVALTANGGFTESVKNSKGVGLSFGIDGSSTVVAGQKTTDGVTTYTVSSDVSVTLNAGVDVKQAGLEYGRTDGIKASYEVSMPEQAAKTTDLASVNPFDPASMPTGTVIRLDGASYASNEFKATFRNVAVETKVTSEEGTSLLVEKTGTDTVRVTAGPTEAISAYNGVGLDFEQVKLMLGNDTSLSGATLKTAEFDLSTPDGLAAYNDFVATGTMPADNGPGVSEVKTIEKLDYSSQAKVDVKLGPLELGIDGAQNTGDSVVTTYPDGTAERTVNLQYSGNVPMTLTQTFDAEGKEIVSERAYAFTIKADENTSQMINAAQTGDVGKAQDGPVKPGDTVTITYTEAEMGQLKAHAEGALEASGGMNTGLRVLTQDYDGNPVSSFDFAIGMARNLGGSDYGSAERLFTISGGADGNFGDGNYVQLPGTVTVHDS
ncbi:LysM domain-containing protein [Luteimonas sp. MC1895]|uniref:LysM peptidoglycan-binding domain-containing protein n=1 Tax=Luteimonas sp. MC1895 TaxID=2819513 RepID=UPI0018F0E77C|nr:LysM domain-containing protein [Luteimonas sp. MC1895]MBJ6978617.1 LysM peptidoglycan-binding domain-containing protein [Luteimonas sp. MC1895]